MDPARFLSLALNPARILTHRGFDVDPWQRDFLANHNPYVLLNCCRQAGKSTVTAVLALHEALFVAGSLVVILSPGQRQSGELFRRVLDNYNALDRPVPAAQQSQLKLELTNGSRILCLPGREETVRCFSPTLLVIDEASRVADDLYRAVRPMLAVSKGRLVALSTPFGQQGWFWSEWHGDGPWKRIQVTWHDCPRISAGFIADEERAMGKPWIQQEYECLFTALEGLVYPEFDKTATDVVSPIGKPCGGIDWGWRNPFAAVWGVLDRDDVLWIQNERYLRQTPLHEHARALPKIVWYADPAGATEMCEFRAAGHTIRKGYNDIRLGIAAVAARIRTGRLKVHAARCPSLCSEARLYRYPSPSERAVLGEKPIDENNHALAALRYLVSRIDARFIAKLRKSALPAHERIEVDSRQAIDVRQTGGRSLLGSPLDMALNDDLWTTF
jgi:hypothetical protein